jgi:hypothetical protein
MGTDITELIRFIRAHPCDPWLKVFRSHFFFGSGIGGVGGT